MTAVTMGRKWAIMLGAAAGAAASGGLDLEEARTAAFFGKTSEPKVPQSAERVSGLTSEKFEELALRGRPFVIEDGGKGQKFVGWTCDRFKKEYPNGVVKMEYVKTSRNPYEKIQSSWEEIKYEIGNVDAGGPTYAPFYWGVKGADDPKEAKDIFKGGSNPLPKVKKQMRLPEFMKQTKENKQEVLGSPEFWFSRPSAGASMHMDSHCESTYAIQLHGTRKWRLGWVPPVPNGSFYKDGTYADGAVYGKGYIPPFEAVVEEGQAIFMPSAFLHESNNIGDDCAVSLTFQFRDPMPAVYFRSSLSHLRRTGDFNECWSLVGQVAALGQKGAKEKGPKLSVVDTDGDGKMSFAEANTKILRAAHAFHDVDQDGFVTADEVTQGWKDWIDALKEAKAKGIKKVNPKSYKYLYEGSGKAKKSEL